MLASSREATQGLAAGGSWVPQKNNPVQSKVLDVDIKTHVCLPGLVSRQLRNIQLHSKLADLCLKTDVLSLYRLSQSSKLKYNKKGSPLLPTIEVHPSFYPEIG